MAHNGFFLLGIDGGGTGTRARVTDASGRVLGSGSAGPATLRLGGEAAFAALIAAADAALAGAGLSRDDSTIFAGIGVAGYSRIAAREALLALLSSQSGFTNFVVDGDERMACLGAHGGADGGIVIVGTGSNAYGRTGEQDVRVGGHGFPISDAGSGADIGLDAVRASVRAHDQQEPATAMTREVLAAVGGSPVRAIEWAERATAPDYAALAPIVVRHAAQGDRAAVACLVEAAQRIGALVEALLDRGVPRVALVGGLAESLTPYLPDPIRTRLSAAQGDAIDGALQAARRLA